MARPRTTLDRLDHPAFYRAAGDMLRDFLDPSDEGTRRLVEHASRDADRSQNEVLAEVLLLRGFAVDHCLHRVLGEHLVTERLLAEFYEYFWTRVGERTAYLERAADYALLTSGGDVGTAFARAIGGPDAEAARELGRSQFDAIMQGIQAFCDAAAAAVQPPA